jgi:hypothetical protein
VKLNTSNKVRKQPLKSRAASKSDSPSLSDPDDEFNKIAEKSSDENNPDGEEDLDVVGMNEQDALKLLDNEVWSFYLSHYLIELSTISLFRFPEILLASLTMMMALRWLV